MSATIETVPARVDPRFRGGMAARASVDVRGLRRRLEETVQGEVRFDSQTKAMSATDASNYRQVPLGVVIPETLDDVVAITGRVTSSGRPSWLVAAGPACPGKPSTSPSSSTSRNIS